MRGIRVAHSCHRVSRLHLESLKDDYSILVKVCVGAPYQELDFGMSLQAIRRGLGMSPQFVLEAPSRNNDVDACAPNN
jgi:hypothetical protein